MAGAEFTNVVIPNVSSEGFELAAKILLGGLPVAEGALAAWDRVPRKLGGALLESAELEMLKDAELGRHSQSPSNP